MLVVAELLPKSVTDVLMAVDTQWHFTLVSNAHLMHGVRMAVQARVLGHASIPGFDLDRFVEVFQRESQRMAKPVVGLGYQVSDEVGGLTVPTSHSLPA